MEMEKYYRDWLTLTQAKGIGPSLCHKLLLQYSTPQNILNSNHAELHKCGLHQKNIQSLFEPEIKEIDRAIDWLQQKNHHLITYHDPDYPELLKSIYAPPPILFAIGQREVINSLPFAIVGSRNPSATGRKLSEEFAFELAKSGLSICSGLALGIDYHGHQGALNAHSSTIAILGNGLDIIYPARHKKIAQQIAESGLLLSEFIPGTKPSPGNFPQRNRIISGMSLGVLVIEAAKKSGSLITAHHALEQGREVFAIPGSIHNPLARGTHSLIKQGAKLVETIDDILEELVPLASIIINKKSVTNQNINNGYDLDSEYQKLLDSMGYDVITIDQLVNSSGLTADAVSSMLLILELQGMIESRDGGKYCRCS